jgi:hypothetical protein
MYTLEEMLEMEIKENGESSPLVQMLRNQIVAERSGKNFQELYITGSVFNLPSSDRLSTIEPHSEETKIAKDPSDTFSDRALEHDMEQNSDIAKSKKNIKK